MSPAPMHFTRSSLSDSCTWTHAPVLAFADPSKTDILHVGRCQFKGAWCHLVSGLSWQPASCCNCEQSIKSSWEKLPDPSVGIYFSEMGCCWQVQWLSVQSQVHSTYRQPTTHALYVLSTTKLSAVGHRWLTALSTYDVRYCTGPDTAYNRWRLSLNKHAQ